MSNPSPAPQLGRRAIADSPWFWVMLFCAAGVIFLLIMSTKYASRQRRLEMQYYARQEIARRQVEGTAAAREAGQEGSQPPPETGELLIPLGPLVTLFAVFVVISAVLFWRDVGRSPGQGGAPPAGRDAGSS
jgi:hypothetical protein